jgi:hypothetical protein
VGFAGGLLISDLASKTWYRSLLASSLDQKVK